MLDDSSQFNYDQLWASVTILTLVSVAIYYLVGAVEAVVLARFGQSAPKH
jgi:ABC-type nitrate/sulfonate/bicarbonate transport system permease component